MNSATLQI